MSAVIVIEIVVGIVILAAAVRFAVRDIMQREAAARDAEAGSADTAQAPAPSTEPAAEAEAAQPLSEVGSTESN
jgi:flagellar biosynthesis/type III secretory pathway M-ring protein FliF/YscJ